MHKWQSLSHVRRDCKYHVVFIPKYRQKALFGRLDSQVGRMLRERVSLTRSATCLLRAKRPVFSFGWLSIIVNRTRPSSPATKAS